MTDTRGAFRDDADTDAERGRSADGASSERSDETERERDRNRGDPSLDSILIVSDHPNSSKIERHYGPLADVAERTTMVCLNPDESMDSITYRTVPTFGHRLIGICLLFLVALVEGLRNRDEYDAIVSISLFPYGCFALVLRPIVGAPAHLGIIGSDIDVHAKAWYGPVTRAAIRRFDSVSVPGSTHRQALREFGVDDDRTHVLANAIDTSHYVPPAEQTETTETTYDFLWIGRFSEEKDPLLFVGALAELAERDPDREFRAVMLGTGAKREDVDRAIAANDLDDAIDLPGWVDDPRTYYADADAFVLTSSRDALPLTLVEAMATGMPSVVPQVGSVPDVARHRETALVVPERTPTAVAEALHELRSDEQLRNRLAENAPAVREDFSYGAARDDWREILETLADS